MAQLPEERRARLLPVKNEEIRREVLCAYGLLHLLLQQRYGREELPECQMGRRGKPAFCEEGLPQFNLSHTQGAVLLGLSESPLGVDIQYMRPVSARVKDRLREAGKMEAGYYRDWARYEAWVKRLGAAVDPHFADADTLDAVELETFPGFSAAYSGEGPLVDLHLLTMDDLF